MGDAPRDPKGWGTVAGQEKTPPRLSNVTNTASDRSRELRFSSTLTGIDTNHVYSGRGVLCSLSQKSRFRTNKLDTEQVRNIIN